jgi:hypothetical protein
MGIIRNQYMGRTFIEPTEQIRNMGVRLKLNVNRALIRGKRVILVDDSVVRGTTSRKIKEMILDAGAAEVHFRIASPPTAWPCFYGVDTPEREKLLAATMSEEEMRAIWGSSLRFISLDGLYRAVGEAKGRDPNAPQYCDACFSGVKGTRCGDPTDMLADLPANGFADAPGPSRPDRTGEARAGPNGRQGRRPPPAGGSAPSDLADLASEPGEDGLEARRPFPFQRASRDRVPVPHPALRGIVAHGPIAEHPVRRGTAMAQRDLHVAVVAADAAETGSDLVGRSFQKLDVKVGPADERTGDAVTRVVAPRLQQDAVQRRLVEAERARGIDQADEVHGASVLGVARGRTHVTRAGAAHAGAPCARGTALSSRTPPGRENAAPGDPGAARNTADASGQARGRIQANPPQTASAAMTDFSASPARNGAIQCAQSETHSVPKASAGQRRPGM